DRGMRLCAGRYCLDCTVAISSLLQNKQPVPASPEGSNGMQPEVARIADAARIAQAVDSRSASGIAAAVSRLIKSGELPAGARRPAVRAVAPGLGAGPTTVTEAWRSLVRVGAVRTGGRGGSFVADPPPAAWPSRFWRIASAAGGFALDLSAGVPDPALLPPM